LLTGAIRTLGITASSDSAPALCALAGAAQHEIRAAVAGALGSLRHACVEPTLRRLTEDSDAYVRLNAGMSYARTPERELAVLHRLFRDSAPRVRTHTALALAELAGTQELVLLREYLSQEPSSSEVVTALCQARSDDVSAFMREVLTSSMGADVLVRAQALGYLRDVADHQSLLLFLRALRSDYIGERTAAAEGIAAIGERGAARALSALLLDQNPHGRLAAARALVKLRAVDSRDSLHRAAASDTSWAKQELVELARQLG
jgi:HEAT repeat protein